MEAKIILLDKIIARIDSGEFDEEFTLPFMNQDLMKSIVTGKINKRADAGGAPILTELELKSVIEEMKESATTTFGIFLANGLIEKTEEGYDLTRKGAIALRESGRMKK